jgi:hypothetical protein
MFVVVTEAKDMLNIGLYPDPIVLTANVRIKYDDAALNPVAYSENRPVLNNPVSLTAVEGTMVDVALQIKPRRVTSDPPVLITNDVTNEDPDTIADVESEESIGTTESVENCACWPYVIPTALEPNERM